MHSIEDKIRQINNPQDFTNLCNTIFSDRYKGDFQIVDGTRSDQGNDGYIYSEKRIFAYHCPVKPENKTDKDYIGKIYLDLEKAKKLHDAGRLEVKKWTFVTPGKLSNDIIVRLHQKAKELGFEGNSIEATHLANELYEKPHLLKKFPYLHVLDIDAKLTEISDYIKNSEKMQKLHEKDKCDIGTFKEGGIDKKEESEDLKKVFGILQKDEIGSSKTELKTIFYKTKDRVAQINIVLGLIKWYNGADEDAKDMIWWCEQGVQLADIEKSKWLRALFLANKGYYLSIVWANEDMETAFMIQVENMFGVPIITAEQKHKKIERFRLLEDQFNDAFNEAMDIAKGLKSVELIAQILLIIGQAASQRYVHLNHFKATERAEHEKALAKRATLLAKDIYSSIRDELKVGYALHNLANQLDLFGEKKEAMELVETTIEIATKYNDESLLQTANWLKEKIITDKVPDYVHGERRERKKRAI